MWKLEDSKLKNKADIWKSSDDWKLPEPGIEDNIQNTSKNTFLDFFTADIESGTMANLGKKCCVFCNILVYSTLFLYFPLKSEIPIY